MGAVLPAYVFQVHQAYVGFVDESGGLQSVAARLASHEALGKPVQLFVNENGQAFQRFFVALFPGVQQKRDFASWAIGHSHQRSVTGQLDTFRLGPLFALQSNCRR